MNPFSMVITELWNMLLAHPCFVRDVKEANRIRFDIANNRDPLKATVMVADLPEVSIVTLSGTGNLMSNSSASQIVRQFSVLISTGDYRYSEFLAPMEWIVFCAMTGWKNRLTALTWHDRKFVTRANMTSIASGLSDPEKNRNVKGWSAVWNVEVEMHFMTSDLLAELSTMHEEAN